MTIVSIYFNTITGAFTELSGDTLPITLTVHDRNYESQLNNWIYGKAKLPLGNDTLLCQIIISVLR